MPEVGAAAGETSRLRVGARWLAGAYAAMGALNYAYALLLIHLLTPRNFADFAAAQGLLLVVGTLATAAVPWVLAHRMAACPGDVSARRAAVSFAIVANAVAGITAAAVVVAVGSRFLAVPALIALAVSTLLIFLATTPAGWLQGRGGFAGLALLRVVEVVTKVVFGAVVGALGAGVTGAIVGFAVGAAVATVVGFWWMRQDLSRTRPDPRLAGAVRMTVGMTAVQGVVAAVTNVDVVLAAVLPVPAIEAASYQAAAVLARTPLFIASGIAAAVFPLLGASRSGDALVRTALNMYLALAVPLTAVLATVPPRIVHWVMPEEYALAPSLLVWLSPAGAAIGLVLLYATLLQSGERYGEVLRRQVPGLVAAVLVLTVAWEVGGVTGFAVGAALAAVGNALALRQAASRTWAGARALRLWVVPVWLLLVGVLWATRDHPAAWMALAVAVGLAGLALALAGRPTTDDPPAPTSPRDRTSAADGPGRTS